MTLALIDRIFNQKKPKPYIETERLILRLPEPKMAKLFLQYYSKNRDHLAPWEANKADGFYTLVNFKLLINDVHQQYLDDTAVRLVIMDKSHRHIIGICNFTAINRGISQSCNLGYAIDKQYQSKGYMYEACKAAINYMITMQGMHRIMANYMPHNKASENLLNKLGFEIEGYAKSFLKIAGKWQDHILTAYIADD